MQVLLVSMPFGALERQALGISLLKARLRESGISCDVRYLNFRFADLIGYGDYLWVNYEAPYTAFAGDWAFTESLYGPRPALDTQYTQEVLREHWRMREEDIERLRRIRQKTKPFLDHCLEAVPWDRYGLVGFTSTFEQNLASLAMAKRLKERFPRIQTIFGGANWEDQMGVEYHRQFPFVDYVISGEAEESLPELCRRLAAGKPVHRPSDPVPALTYRHKGATVTTGTSRPVERMDSLPRPDYSDYFEALRQSGAGSEVVPTLLFETSRGCWWGAKSHCTFCGLNGRGMAYRSKSQARALDEMLSLAAEWQVEMLEAADNILDMSYFESFLPALAERSAGLHIFFEVKANLSRRHLRMMRDAGVRRVQPGIESMSDHVLSLMRKGTTALRNIQMLKWAREYGVKAEWNLLYGFPGETREDYTRMLTLLKQVPHLNPPTACGPLRLDRFSPYHHDPAAYGLKNLRALSTYRFLYPFDEASLMRLAYYFDFDYDAGVDPADHAEEVIRYCAEWKARPQAGRLAMIRRPDGALALVDTRPTAQWRGLLLTGQEQAAYEYCDEVHTLQAITRHLQAKFPQAGIGENAVRGFLDSAVENGMMATDGKSYLSLAEAISPLREELEQAKGQPVLPVPAPAAVSLVQLPV